VRADGPAGLAQRLDVVTRKSDRHDEQSLDSVAAYHRDTRILGALQGGSVLGVLSGAAMGQPAVFHATSIRKDATYDVQNATRGNTTR
jgi:hypothetical protein